MGFTYKVCQVTPVKEIYIFYDLKINELYKYLAPSTIVLIWWKIPKPSLCFVDRENWQNIKWNVFVFGNMNTNCHIPTLCMLNKHPMTFFFTFRIFFVSSPPLFFWGGGGGKLSITINKWMKFSHKENYKYCPITMPCLYLLPWYRLVQESNFGDFWMFRKSILQVPDIGTS